MSHRLDNAAANLPNGLRDGVSSYLMAREMELPHDLSARGRTMAGALRNARIGIPCNAEQEARWRRLGIHPDQTK